MKKKDVLRINKKHQSITKDKHEKHEKHKIRHNSKKGNIQTLQNETQIPNSMKPDSGVSEIQGMKGLQSMPGLEGMSERQNAIPITQSNYPNQPQKIYQTPAVMTNNMQMQVVPVVNQVAPMPIGPMVFGLGPAQIVCPHCGANALTKAEEKFNCFSCICCVFNIVMVPVLIFASIANVGKGDCSCDCNCNCDCERCNGKCCCDVNHICANCGKLKGRRSSMKVVCPLLARCCP